MASRAVSVEYSIIAIELDRFRIFKESFSKRFCLKSVLPSSFSLSAVVTEPVANNVCYCDIYIDLFHTHSWFRDEGFNRKISEFQVRSPQRGALRSHNIN